MGEGSDVVVRCGVGCRRGSDLMWLWLAAVAPVGPLAWEPLYAVGAALKSKKEKKDIKYSSLYFTESPCFLSILYFWRFFQGYTCGI